MSVEEMIEREKEKAERKDRIQKATEKERLRLNRIFKDIPDDHKKTVQGLIIQAARLRASLDDAWEDIMEDGEYELFTQSENTPPYERERPIARLFTQRNGAYQKAITDLIKLLPHEEQEKVSAEYEAGDLM